MENNHSFACDAIDETNMYSFQSTNEAKEEGPAVVNYAPAVISNGIHTIIISKNQCSGSERTINTDG